MTKQSANPRRYSRGPEALNPDQPLSVFLSLRVQARELQPTADRISYLCEQHPTAVVDLAGYRRDMGELILTLEVKMGPARAALRGTSEQLSGGYDFLWDAARTLYYASPILCSPPQEAERARAGQMGENLLTGRTATPAPVARTA